MLRRGSNIPEEADIRAFLGKGVLFKGALSFEGTVRVDGRLEGEVITKDSLIVGEEAEIKGEIRVGTLVSSGRIEGNVTAGVKVTLMAPAVLCGDVQTPVLTIEEGVKFDGRCAMTQHAEKHVEKRALAPAKPTESQTQTPVGSLRSAVQGKSANVGASS